MTGRSSCCSTRRGLLGLAAATIAAPAALAQDMGFTRRTAASPAGAQPEPPSGMPAPMQPERPSGLRDEPRPHAPAQAPKTAAPASPEAALQRLLDGNLRFVSGRLSDDGEGPRRRAEVAQAQNPFAVVLTCADSRLAPEILFDQGLGDLFVVRVAGNVLDDALLGSIEYGVLHLGARVIMVVGHERCGAVQAAVEALDAGASEADMQTSIPALVAAIAPAIDAARVRSGALLDTAVDENAMHSARQILARSPLLKARTASGALKVVAARYDLDDGKVRLL